MVTIEGEVAKKGKQSPPPTEPIRKANTENLVQNRNEGALEKLSNVGKLTDRTPFYRAAFDVSNRNAQVMSWQLPDGDTIQMYINPQNFVVRESKQITETRTKGGFVIQYWGENLINISISGHTGSSGVRGIEVLRDIYRSENAAFDLVRSQRLREVQQLSSQLNTSNTPNEIFNNAAQSTQSRSLLLSPSLGAIAASVILFYQGVQYKGFFRDFTVTESVSNLGLFDYAITFIATERRGQRKNFMAWHKEPNAGDLAGLLINGIGNSIRGLAGLAPQSPESFHPANAPYSFGGTSLSGSAGLRSGATVNALTNGGNTSELFI